MHTSYTPTTRKPLTSTGAALIRAFLANKDRNGALRTVARSGFNSASHEMVGRTELDRLADLR